MSLRDARKKRREEANLEMTPLIDVVFLLLIFFLITTTFSQGQEDELPIDLPEAVSGESATEGEKVVLSITEDGSVDIEGDEPLEGDSVDDQLSELYERKSDAAVVLRGDEAASHGEVIEVLDKIKETGFEKVNLVTSRPQGGGQPSD